MEERFVSRLGKHAKYWFEHHRPVDPFFADNEDRDGLALSIGMPVQHWWHSADHLYPQVAARFGLKRWEPPKPLKDRSNRLKKHSGGPDCYPEYSKPRDLCCKFCFSAFAYTYAGPLPSAQFQCPAAQSSRQPTLIVKYQFKDDCVKLGACWFCTTSVRSKCPLSEVKLKALPCPISIPKFVPVASPADPSQASLKREIDEVTQAIRSEATGVGTASRSWKRTLRNESQIDASRAKKPKVAPLPAPQRSKGLTLDTADAGNGSSGISDSQTASWSRKACLHVQPTEPTQTRGTISVRETIQADVSNIPSAKNTAILELGDTINRLLMQNRQLHSTCEATVADHQSLQKKYADLEERFQECQLELRTAWAYGKENVQFAREQTDDAERTCAIALQKAADAKRMAAEANTEAEKARGDARRYLEITLWSLRLQRTDENALEDLEVRLASARRMVSVLEERKEALSAVGPGT